MIARIRIILGLLSALWPVISRLSAEILSIARSIRIAFDDGNATPDELNILRDQIMDAGEIAAIDIAQAIQTYAERASDDLIRH